MPFNLYVAKILLSAILLFVGFSFSAHAAEPLRFRSRFYQVTTDLPREIAQEAAQHMDVVYAEYAGRFRAYKPKNPGQEPLFVFNSNRDYMAFLAQSGVEGAGSGGIFFVNPRGSALATFLEGQGVDRMFHTLRHEGFHQFAFNRIGPGLPVWANEGLAEYFAISIVSDKKLHAGQVPVLLLRSLRETVAAGKHIPFEKLLTMSDEQWGKRVARGEGGMQYVQSWAIVHFLVHGHEKYRKAFEVYLQMVASGVGSDQAFVRAFGVNSYDDFEKAWKEYLDKLEPSPEATAAQRVTFLAQGLLFLHKEGVGVKTLDELKTELRRRQFGVQHSLGAGVTMEFKSSDDENFQLPAPAATGPKAKPVTMELTPAAKPSLPPGLRVTGLKFPVVLDWQTLPDGSLSHHILYDTLPSKK